MKNILFSLFLTLSFQIIFAQSKSDSISTQLTIDSYLQKVDNVIEDDGSNGASFIGKIKGHNFFKRMDENLLKPVNIELNLIKNSDVADDENLKESYEKLLKLHNNSIIKMQKAISSSSGYGSILNVSLKKIYKEDKKEIEKLATDFIDLSYQLRTNQQHASIIDFILVAFKVGKLIKKFGVKLEETAKPIIISNLENHKLKSWDEIIGSE